jgi:hypothetical protein
MRKCTIYEHLIFRIGRSGVRWGFVGRGGGFIGWGRVSGSLVGGCGSFVLWSLVGWGRVGRSRVGRRRVSWRFVIGLLVFGMSGLAFVLDVSVVTIAVGLVGNDLGAAVGESDFVRASGYFSVGALGMDKVIVRWLILHVVRVAVGLGGLMMHKTNQNHIDY